MITDEEIENVKIEISNVLRQTLKQNKLSIRRLAMNLGMQHPQVLRITSCENYTINNLIKILDEAGLKIEVVKK